MKERPILFSGPMVRALLAGTKTQTRRVVKWKPREGANLDFSGLQVGHYCTGMPSSGFVLRSQGGNGWNDRTFPIHCPYGQPGDRLWVRETFAHVPIREDDGGQGDRMGYIYRADGESAFDAIPDEWDFTGPWKPSIFMPRSASRITLEVTGVRVERLQDISEEDAIEEGVERACAGWKHYFFLDDPSAAWEFARNSYASLWESINGPNSWEANPWIWVVEFKRVQT